MTEQQPLNAGRIWRLEVDNVKKMKAVRVTPEGNLIIVSGQNDQGKSSFLDAVRFGLGGASAMKKKTDDKPDVVRHGQVAAKVLIELDDLIVTRTMVDGKQAVKVESKSGGTLKSPQGILDAFMTSLTFDPLKFAQLPNKQQREVLLGLVDLGIDLDEHEAQRQKAYDDRREVGREVTRLEGVLQSAPTIRADVPDAEVSVSQLMGELADAESANSQRVQAEQRLETRQTRVATLREELARVKAQLEEAEAALHTDVTVLQSTPELVDVAPIKARISTADAVNAEVRNKQRYREVKGEHAAAVERQESYTAQIGVLDRIKQDALGNAEMPIAGLSFDDDGVTFEGVPLSQISESATVKVSAAIQMALHPSLRIMLIGNGNALDQRNLKVLEEMAAENDYQIFVTYVGDSGLPQLVIEDGEVVA